MIFKCPLCYKEHEAKDKVIISICDICQVEMEKWGFKEEEQNGEKRD